MLATSRVLPPAIDSASPCDERLHRVVVVHEYLLPACQPWQSIRAADPCKPGTQTQPLSGCKVNLQANFSRIDRELVEPESPGSLGGTYGHLPQAGQPPAGTGQGRASEAAFRKSRSTSDHFFSVLRYPAAHPFGTIDNFLDWAAPP